MLDDVCIFVPVTTTITVRHVQRAYYVREDQTTSCRLTLVVSHAESRGCRDSVTRLRVD